MGQCLSAHVSYLQDDWSDWLPLAEFGMYGQDPQWKCDLTPWAANGADDRRAHTMARRLSKIHEHLRAEMGRAQERYAANADRNRLSAPRFLPGDRVWLNARNTITRPLSGRLDRPARGGCRPVPPHTACRGPPSSGHHAEPPGTPRLPAGACSWRPVPGPAPTAVRGRRLDLATGHTLAAMYIVRGFSPLHRSSPSHPDCLLARPAVRSSPVLLLVGPFAHSSVLFGANRGWPAPPH